MGVRLAVCVALAASAGWAASAREQLVALRAKLAASRVLDRSSGWDQLVRFAEQHRKEAALAAEVLYDVGVVRLRRESSGSSAAMKTLELLLERYPDEQPWAALATFRLARALVERSSARLKAVELYEKFLARDDQPPWRRSMAEMGLAHCYQQTGKHQEALTHYRRAIEEFPAHRRQAAEALSAIGSVLVSLKRPQEAYQTYLTLRKDYPWAGDGGGDLLLSIAQAHRTAGDPDGARTAYERLLADVGGTDTRRAYAYRGLAMLHLQDKNAEGAAAVYRRMAKDLRLTASYRVQAYSQLFEMHRKANDFPAMIRLGHELIAAHPSRVLSSSYKVFDELVDAFSAQGRIEEALGMAKAYYRLSLLGYGNRSASSSRSSSYGSRQYAVFTVVRALKAREGGLRSANAFLTFVGYGPEGPDGRLGTKDDVPDPLAQYKLPPNAERDTLFAEAAKRLRPDPLELGYLYICWDKPTEALRAFRRCYLEARTATEVQAAATRMARAMRAMGAAEAEVDAFFDFQNYGPHGKDGKPRTADDLKDPVLERK